MNTALKAELVVQSRDMSLDEISVELDRTPVWGQELGAINPRRSVPYQWTSWSIPLSWRSDLHGGTEGLSNAIEALGASFAQRLAMLRARGCDVVLSIVQEVSDDSASTGIHLSEQTIAWLAAAGACIDIDQYFDDES